MQQERAASFVYKLVLIGDTGVGKSSLLLRFSDDTFADEYISTIGVDFRFKTITVEAEGEQHTVKLQIWDTAGQERFRTVTHAYYRGADGILFVYDVTQERTFEHIEEWLSEVNAHANNPMMLLVGNKADLENQRRVSLDTAVDFWANHANSNLVIDTSAKTSTGVEEAFRVLATELAVRDVRDRKQQQSERRLAVLSKRMPNRCC